MKLSLISLALLFALLGSRPSLGQAATAEPAATGHRVNHAADPLNSETRYLAFQIFTWSPDPRDAGFGREGTTLPAKASLLPYIQDIKGRIGTVGDRRDRLGFMLGPISCFDQSDADVEHFVKVGFDLALETNMAVGFKVDDSMFWGRRKDLWSDRRNVEAMDWEGTPSTGRRLDWGTSPTEAPPQMCFNSPTIEREVRKRASVIGRAIVAGTRRLQAANRPELFIGVIAGWETMIGQDFATGKSLGYRALMNRGFSRTHQPADKDLELGKVVQDFIDLWSKGLSSAGVPADKIYSHTAFVSHRMFNLGDHPTETYAEQNHFAPPSVAFGPDHRPGFSTYPQPGLFDEIYSLVAERKPSGWASSEGTNLQLGAGAGHSGMNMETYLAKMFNHGATLVNIFSWGIGGEAQANNEFRQVTESDEALTAYRNFLHGDALAEASSSAPTLMERLPLKIRKVQQELPNWVQTSGRGAKAEPMIKELEAALKAKDFDRAEKAADALLKLTGDSSESKPIESAAVSQELTDENRRRLRHEFGFWFLATRDKIQAELDLSPEQKAAIDKYLTQVAPADIQFLDAHPQHSGEFEAFKSQALDSLKSILQKTLTDVQWKRLEELVRQKEGLFGGPRVWGVLEITDEEKGKFMALIEPMSKKMMAMVSEAEHGANPAEIQHQVLSLRADLERQLEGVLTDAQRKQWQEMLGKPMPVDALFDLTN